MFKRMLCGVLVGLALSMLVPAGAPAAFCPEQPSAQRFLRWIDPAWYVGLPGGGFEPSTPAWTLTGGAAVVEGNEPFYIGGAGDSRSLRLPAGATATSPAMCIGVDHPTLRLLVRNSGSLLGSRLNVSVVFRGLGGEERTLPIAALSADRWAPTPPLVVGVNALSLAALQSVAFRFEADGGSWAIDDVYVDPYGKG